MKAFVIFGAKLDKKPLPKHTYEVEFELDSCKFDPFFF